MAMAGPAIRIGDQLILEEDYDETYIPSEQEINEFARVIGIDPENEAELMWLAREGIVAPLPAEWKPCQDITGDIYYFNFANGQSMWDHPCDERYRQLVAKEREKLLGHGGFRKKEKKKKKKDKKEKGEKDLLKHPFEVQSEVGILPSTSFYRVSSPVLSSGHASPELEQQEQGTNLITRNEPFLKSHKGMPSGMSSYPSDLPRLLSGPAPGKLQPLLPTKSTRTHQILADVEKILGKASFSNRPDSGHHSCQDLTAEIRSAAVCVLSDSEPENLDSAKIPMMLFQALKEPTDKTVLGLEAPKNRSLFLENEKLGKDQDMEGGGVCQSLVDSSPGERAMGPVNYIVKDRGFLQVIEKEIQQFPPAAVSPVLVGEKCEPSITEGEGDADSLQNDLRSPCKVKESRKGRKLQEQQCQAVELSVSKRESTQQGEAPVPDSQLQASSLAFGAETGTGGNISPLLVAAVLPAHPRGEKTRGERPDFDGGNGGGGSSSMTSSLADHLASQILGEVDNFSWDLQSSHESDRPMEQVAAIKRSFLEAPHIQTQSSLDDRSESECYTEDQKFYRHMIHMVKRSRGAEQAVPKPLKQQQSGCEEFGTALNAELDTAQEGAVEVGARPRQGVVAFKEGGLQSPVESQVCSIQNSQAEGEQVQSRTLAKNDNRPERSPEEDRGEESPRGTGRLLKNLHVDVSALGASFDNEASEGSNPMKEWQVSDHLVPDPLDIVSTSFENILDVLPPVLGSPKFGVSRATVESTWKEEATGWSAQEKEQSKGSLEEEQSRGSAKGNVEAEVKHTEEKHAEDSLRKTTRAEQTLLEQAKIHFLQEKQTHIQHLQEKLQQEEEEEIQMLHQQKKDALQSLKAELEAARQEEELRLREEVQDELLKLQTQIYSEAEAEKEEIRLAQEAALHKLREELESFQQSEEDGLKEQKRLSLERMKKEAEGVQQAALMELEQENQRALSELKERLCRGSEAAMQELKVQFSAEIQQQKSAAKEHHQKVVSALQKQIKEAQRREESELQQELESAEQKVLQKRHQVTEYERELGDLLKEKRQEVERDHARQLEKMQEAHRETLAENQAQHEEEGRKLRAELLAALQCEQERLELLHKAELEALRKKQARQLKDLHKSHQEQEQNVQDMELELELRAKDVQARVSQVHAQEEVLRKKRQQALEEEKQLEQERDEAALAAQLHHEESQKDQEDLAETTQELRRILVELQDRKSELESQVEMLQLQSQQLQKRVSELEVAIKSKQELLKKMEVENCEASPRKQEEAFRVEDLQESVPVPSFRELASETPKRNEERGILLEQVQRTISTEGASLKTAREFLVRQTHSMQKRQSALKAAKRHWRYDLQRAPGAAQDPGLCQQLEGVRRTLEVEARKLHEMNSSVQRGEVLVKQKEEVLSQLESSLLEELSEEDTLKGVACKKVVTFDLSDSKDTSSMMSTEESPRKMVDMKPDHQFLPFDEIHYLTNSLQCLTRDLIVVLEHLSTFSNQQLPFFTPTKHPGSPMPRDGIPLAGAPSAAPSVPTVGPQWAWNSSGPSPSALAGQSVNNTLLEKWCKYFPGRFPLPCGSPGPLDGKLGYMTSGEQGHLFQHPKAERPNIQGMIEANKKWLESFKQDSKVPAFWLLSSF
ncbi:centrosomal protein of 164 kDa isoform X2 [Rhineura floridana]|uniref:centrosomal protein of 164 kDa isoform X2 n=1 Tax=Rhineura floridana TaxID=261503 RepID=UPI002AC82814|nr:centrosomal protein of 164 kDa isoform X2 [Rhineura floridana]